MMLYDNVKYSVEYGRTAVIQTIFTERTNTSQSDIPHLNSIYAVRMFLFNCPYMK